jgi:hypothetical protein
LGTSDGFIKGLTQPEDGKNPSAAIEGVPISINHV